MRAWRNNRGALFIECEKCNSRGTAHASTVMRTTPEIAIAVSQHRTAVMSMRDKATVEMRDIVEQTQRQLAGLHDQEAIAKVRKRGAELVAKRYQEHVALVLAAEQRAPKFETAPELLLACPWGCGNSSETIVEKLPADQPDPWHAAQEKTA